MNYTQRVQKLIREAVKRCGSQQLLSEALGCDRSTVNHWIKQRRIPLGTYVLQMQDLIEGAKDGKGQH
jgi:biotin operon repressor